MREALRNFGLQLKSNFLLILFEFKSEKKLKFKK